MQALTRHVILNYLDTPLKIIFFTLPELGILLGPFLLGVLVQKSFLGFGLSILSLILRRKYQRKFGKGQFEALKYWYLPQTRSLRFCPASYIREYLG